MFKFKPTHKYNELFDFNKFYGERGSRKFDGTYSEQKYYDFLEIVKKNNISDVDWPYYELEEDFYTYNSMGYRTYEFSDLQYDSFDIAIGCSFTEGIGIRASETWVSHLEKKLNTKIINLGKGGSSAKYVKHTLFSWVMSNRKLPNRVFILWTEPTRKTYIRTGGAPQHLNYQWKIDPALDLDDSVINDVYEKLILSNTMWSNEFVEDYCSVNVLLKSLNIKVYNCLIDSMWRYDPGVFEYHTGIAPYTVDFTKNVSGWFKMNEHKIYPAYDGVHLGEQHHISVANQILINVQNEEN